MTRLVKWLRIGGALIIVWIMALNDKFGKFNSTTKFHILVCPIYLFVVFGIISVFVLINQVIKITNCDQAYRELKSEIVEAKSELNKKGFKFD